MGKNKHFPRSQHRIRHTIRRRFTYTTARFWPFALLFYIATCPASPSCQPDRIDQVAEVNHHYDGDTLTLSNGQKLRIIGLDTPELPNAYRRQTYDQDYLALARAAKKRTGELLKRSKQRVKLRFDQERYDRHGRQLAHVFLDDNRNLAAQLIADGLAIQFAIPPNLALLECYTKHEQSAQKQQLGIWQHPRYQTIEASALDKNSRGFHLIAGKVGKLKNKSGARFIQVKPNLIIRIAQQNQAYFKSDLLAQLPGKHILVRGWLHKNKDHFFMNLYHPSALNIVPHPDENRPIQE